MASNLLFVILLAYFFNPASANAPAGSDNTRVSSKISFTAAHNSSMLTVITPSTHSLITSKLFFPTFPTATPSANKPTSRKRTRLLAFSASVKQAESSTSTPYTFVLDCVCATQAPTPAKSPPPPTGTKITSNKGSASKISLPTVPWPAIVN